VRGQLLKVDKNGNRRSVFVKLSDKLGHAGTPRHANSTRVSATTPGAVLDTSLGQTRDGTLVEIVSLNSGAGSDRVRVAQIENQEGEI